MMSPRFCSMILVTAALIGCAGDSGTGSAKRPACTKVSGIVTLNGDPVEGASVMLHPAAKGSPAMGITDFGGRFVLETFEKADGVVPGEYKITVRKMEAGTAPAAPKEGEPQGGDGPKPTEPTNLLPVKYLEPEGSGLSVTVGKEPITALELKLEG